MRINYEIADIEAFVAVAECLSFATAAEQLHLSASSLSRRVQKLETVLGRRLLDRTTREVKLTLAGKQLLNRAHEIIETLEEIQLSLKGEKALSSPTITLACVQSSSRRYIPPAIEPFFKLYPRARLRLLDLNSNESVEAVRQRRADFAISYGVNYISQDELSIDCVQLGEEAFVLAVPKEHPYAKKDVIRWHELNGERLISSWNNSGSRLLIDQALAKAGIRIQWFHEVQHISAALMLIQSGLGIAAVPEHLLIDRTYPGLVGIKLVDPHLTRAVNLVKMSGLALRPIAQNFWDILVKSIDQE